MITSLDSYDYQDVNRMPDSLERTPIYTLEDFVSALTCRHFTMVKGKTYSEIAQITFVEQQQQQHSKSTRTSHFFLILGVLWVLDNYLM